MTENLTDNFSAIPVPGKADAYLQRGVDLHKSGQFEAATACYRAALQQRPDFPPAWTTLGLAHMAVGKLTEAEDLQREALRLDPTFPEAHNGLGLVHYHLGRVAEAENCFRGCLRLWPEHPGAHLNLAVALQSRGVLDAAEVSYREALRYGADPEHVHNNLSVLLRETGRMKEAEAAARTALHLRPEMPDAQINLAMVLLQTGRWLEAWPLYESRWQIGDLAVQRRTFAQLLWTGEQPLAGKTILLHAEQGFGDTLHFCRYAPLVAAKGARVVLEVQPPLTRLLASLEGVAQIVAAGDPLPDFDLHCPLMSLPRAFATTPETIPAPVPYLAADLAQQNAWREVLSDLPGPRVGLVWAGSARAWLPHAAAIDRRRSMRLADMAPLAQARGYSFVSLQLGLPAAQLAEAPAGLLVHNPAAHLGDFADTAALVANLDLVISVDTAVAHLAGALGRPVWLLNRFDSCWRWLLGREDSPWYPALRQFRCGAQEDWTSVMQRVAATLTQFAS